MSDAMNIEVLADSEAVADKSAAIIAGFARQAAADRGRFVMAVSGGRTPWVMLRALAASDVPWPAIHIVQVDERIAPEGHPDRNLTHLREVLFDLAPLRPEQIHGMPVESGDLCAATSRYAAALLEIAGSPAVLDLVHLGLGADGHTASLVPGDPVLNVDSADVALTEEYQGRRRMTLTYPILNRARRVLWVVTGSEKADAYRRLLQGDRSIPAGGIRREGAILLSDCAAAVEGEMSCV
jgi:6-phosphogluconolactonase